MSEARSIATRRADVIAALEREHDVWVATSGPDGAHLVPLSFCFEYGRLVLATAASSATIRNIEANPLVRLGLGPTRDVVMIDGAARVMSDDEAARVADRYVDKIKWDPRGLRQRHVFFEIAPSRIQAWREANELADRDVMVDGSWRD